MSNIYTYFPTLSKLPTTQLRMMNAPNIREYPWNEPDHIHRYPGVFDEERFHNKIQWILVAKYNEGIDGPVLCDYEDGSENILMQGGQGPPPWQQIMAEYIRAMEMIRERDPAKAPVGIYNLLGPWVPTEHIPNVQSVFTAMDYFTPGLHWRERDDDEGNKKHWEAVEIKADMFSKVRGKGQHCWPTICRLYQENNHDPNLRNMPIPTAKFADAVNRYVQLFQPDGWLWWNPQPSDYMAWFPVSIIRWYSLRRLERETYQILNNALKSKPISPRL